MDTLRRRSWARTVACVDLVLVLICTIASIAVIVIAATTPEDLIDEEEEGFTGWTAKDVEKFQKILIGCLVVGLAINGAVIYLDYRLFVATKVSGNPLTARKVAHAWIVVHIILAILFLASIERGYWWEALIHTAIQGVMLVVLYSFVKELNKFLSRPQLPVPLSRVGVGGLIYGNPNNISKPPLHPGQAPLWTVET